jgi:hypothetical protein
MVRLRVKTAPGKCFRDIVLCQLADATRRISGLRERCRLVRDGVSQTSILQRWTVTKIWPPGSKSRDVTQLAELLRPGLTAGGEGPDPVSSPEIRLEADHLACVLNGLLTPSQGDQRPRQIMVGKQGQGIQFHSLFLLPQRLL